jgi:MFS family permease
MIMLVLVDAVWSMGYTEFQIASNPLFKYLHASNKLVGLVTGFAFIELLGVFLSPFITVRFRQKKWYLFIAHIPYLGSLGMIGVMLLLTSRFGFSKLWLLNMVIVLSAASWLFGGFVTLPHWEYSAACLPMSHRGRFYGISFTAGSIMGLVSNEVARHILKVIHQPMSYGYLFIMTWLICQLGYIAALFAKEKPTPIEKAPRPWSKEMIKAVVYDKPYLRALLLYLIFYTCFVAVIAQFAPLYGLRVLKMPDEAAATIGIVQKVVLLSTMFLIGWLVDRVSAKTVATYSSIVMFVALSSVVFLRSPLGVYMCAGVGGLFNALLWAAFMPLFYGLPKPENRAGHFTAQIVTWYLGMTLSPILTGFMCDALGYLPTFAVLGALGLIGIPLAKYLLAPLSTKTEDYA